MSSKASSIITLKRTELAEAFRVMIHLIAYLSKRKPGQRMGPADSILAATLATRARVACVELFWKARWLTVQDR